MSDPLSVAASVTGLITISAKIALMAKKLIDSVKDAPASISRIQEEVKGMHNVCTEVQLFMSRAHHMPNNAGLTLFNISHLQTAMSGCVMVCSNLDKMLSELCGLARPNTSKFAQTGQGNRTFLVKLKWALWKEEEAQTSILNLHRYQSSLSLMLNLVQW